MALKRIPRDPVVDKSTFEHFACDPIQLNPATPDRLEPDVVIERKVYTNLDVDGLELRMPDDVRVRMWGFYNPETRPFFPNETMRVREGQIVHTVTNVSTNTHTIHHHGIEPTTFNDGVPHTSFEIKGNYTYQWSPRRAGTYLYHCHKNATLHFEIGMYGALIVDPPQGPGFVRRANDVIPYDVEAIWALDDLDPRWHELNHSAGLVCPFDFRSDAAMHIFQPRYFLITGVPTPFTESDPRVAVQTQVGHTALLRILNASFTITRIRIHELDAELIGIDGRPLGMAPEAQYTRPRTIPANTPFEMVTAQRHDLLVRPQRRGTFLVEVDYLHWIRRTVLHTARTFIHVA